MPQRSEKMVKFVKTLYAFLLILSVAAFSLVIYGRGSIPDEIVVISDKGLPAGTVFTMEKVYADKELRTSSSETDGENSGDYKVNISLLNIIPVKSSKLLISQRHYVVPGGEIFGLKLYSDGVMIVGTGSVETADGTVNPAEKAGISAGDIVLKINGKNVSRSAEVSRLFQSSGGEAVRVTLLRNNEVIEADFCPALCVTDGIYKAGLWVRDSAAGIGTITYYDSESCVYGSLGHAVCDIDTNEIIPILNGEAVKARVTGRYKGESGKAGELCGVFSGGTLGSIMLNGETGVFGVIGSRCIPEKSLIPVATSSEVKTGKAQIISTVDGSGPQTYDIEITKIFKSGDSVRNMSVKVKDPALIEKTGGIVQGMSGSPIIQNGMLIGAITHVFINDSLQGYAIFAENMISTSDNLVSFLYSEAA